MLQTSPKGTSGPETQDIVAAWASPLPSFLLPNKVRCSVKPPTRIRGRSAYLGSTQEQFHRLGEIV
jgi:hypothetical protein